MKQKPDDLITEIQTAFISGASAHMVALKYKISHERAVELQRQAAERLKNEMTEHKIFLRNMVRLQVPQAMQTLIEAHTGLRKNPHTNKIEDVYGTDEKTVKTNVAKINARVKAAQAILNAAKDFLNDNIFTALAERPGNSGMQPTVFDFEVQDRDGKLILTGETRHLKVVGDDVYEVDEE